MLKQLPFKKEYLLVVAALLLALVSYQLAFKKTIEASQLNSQLKKRLAQSTDVRYQPGYLERKNNNLSDLVSHFKADTIGLRNNILNTISTIAEKENVKVSEVPPLDPVYLTDKYVIQKLNLEGDYNGLEKVIYQIQSTAQIGFLRAVTFKIIQSPSLHGNLNKLTLEISLELIR
jgi:hypothetical protein